MLYREIQTFLYIYMAQEKYIPWLHTYSSPTPEGKFNPILRITFKAGCTISA